MAGYNTQRTVNITILEKLCMKCLCAEKRGENVQEKKFPRNFEVSRKGVDASAALILPRKMYERGVIITYVFDCDKYLMKVKQ